jgi:N-acetylmuramoyl-L-alanine amidase
LQSQLYEVTTQILPETTEITFPLSSPTPIEIQQSDRAFGLTLHNTVSAIQRLSEPTRNQNWPANQTVAFQNPVISQAHWQQLDPNTVQINFQLKPRQQWGYQMRYVGNSLVISLRQPPRLIGNNSQPLRGIRVVVDPGHGAIDSGAIGRAYGVTYMEKTLNINFSDLLQEELERRGAVVTMTRTTDVNPSLDERQVIINQVAPAVSISIHHDASTPGRTKGASIYWYHPQSQDLAASLLDYFSRNGNRPILNNNGVIQRSFAVARPSGAPAVLLEVGFMTNPQEVTELARPDTQQRLAQVLADGITQWIFDRAVS